MSAFRRGARNTIAAALVAAGLAACGTVEQGEGSRVDPRLGVAASPRVVQSGPVPKGGGRAVVGRPYTIGGVTYVPREDPYYSATGTASWYGEAFHGRLTANGEIFDAHALSAAHPTMPLPSYARVTNLETGLSLVVRVNDRGPYHGGRLIDVSRRAADLLDFRNEGLARVRVDYVGPAGLDGSDDVALAATLAPDGIASGGGTFASHAPFAAPTAAPTLASFAAPSTAPFASSSASSSAYASTGGAGAQPGAILAHSQPASQAADSVSHAPLAGLPVSSFPPVAIGPRTEKS